MCDAVLTTHGEESLSPGSRVVPGPSVSSKSKIQTVKTKIQTVKTKIQTVKMTGCLRYYCIFKMSFYCLKTPYKRLLCVCTHFEQNYKILPITMIISSAKSQHRQRFTTYPLTHSSITLLDRVL